MVNDRHGFRSVTCTISFSLLTNPGALTSGFSTLSPYIFLPLKNDDFLHSKAEGLVTMCIVKVAPNIVQPCISESEIH